MSSKWMKVRCQNDECNHEWNYRGDGKFYATCPHCYNKVNIRKLKGEPNPQEDVGDVSNNSQEVEPEMEVEEE